MGPSPNRRSRRALALRRGPVERAGAWLLTGPLGHLYAVLADICEMGVRQLAESARRRARR